MKANRQLEGVGNCICGSKNTCAYAPGSPCRQCNKDRIGYDEICPYWRAKQAAAGGIRE